MPRQLSPQRTSGLPGYSRASQISGYGKRKFDVSLPVLYRICAVAARRYEIQFALFVFEGIQHPLRLLPGHFTELLPGPVFCVLVPCRLIFGGRGVFGYITLGMFIISLFSLLRLLIELNRMGKTIMVATHDLALIRAAKSHVQARVLRISNRRLQLAGADL